MKRADLVPSLFQSMMETEEEVDNNLKLDLFYAVRETFNLIWPFVGIPQVIPALLGIAGYLRSKGIHTLERNRQR